MSINILMPALSPTMEKGNLARWLVKEGDKVSAGDVIAEIETDKAIMEFESIEDGILGKILVPAGTNDVAVNTPVAILLESGETVDSLNIPTVNKSSLEESIQKNTLPLIKNPKNLINLNKGNIFPPESNNRIIASPLAKKLAKDMHINLFDVKGTGPNGRIIKNDVLKFSEVISTKKSSVMQNTKDHLFSFDSPFEIRPISNMRHIIAKRLSESKQNIPHFYLNIDISLDSLFSLREKINSFESSANICKVSVNDFIIKACAKALSIVPDVNVAWSSTGLKYYKRADIAMAVAIDDGLITPIIHGACEKTLHAIAKETKELISLARANKLKPEQYQGGTFSISNLGMYGISSFSAIINPPQACILAVGAATQRPICSDGKIIPASVMTVTLSVDHRAVDGAAGAIFLQTLKKIIETPLLILC